MRLARLELLAYGHLRDALLELDRPHAGLTVVCGPNEAGKSTTRRALLAALFGIPSPATDAYLHGRAGLRIGARLVRDDGRELAFVRQGLTRSPLVDAAGRDLDRTELDDALGGVGRQLYERMFSVDHDELRTRSEELLDAAGEIGRLVFGATLGSGSAPAVLQRLDARAAQLYTERGHTQLVTAALKRHRDGMRQAREARVRSRDLDRRRAAVGEARAKVDEIDARLRAKRAEHSRLRRVQGALHLVARRDELARQRQDIEAEGIVASRDWAERAATALGRLEDATAQHQRASATKGALLRRIGDIEVRHDLLERGIAVDRLVEDLGRFVKDRSDLGERRGQLTEAQGDLVRLLGRLGLGADDGRLVSEAALTAVEELAQRHAMLETGFAAATDELSRLDASIAATRRDLEDLPEPADIGALARAVELAAPVVGRADALLTLAAELAGLHQDARAQATRLGLGGRDLLEVEALPVPSARQIADERARREALAARRAQLQEQAAGNERERGRLEGEIATTLGRPGVPDPARLQAARQHRDAGWGLVRAALGGGVLDEKAVRAWAGHALLADAFEAALQEADAAADDRYEHAEELSAVAERRSRLHALAEADRSLAEQRQHLEREAADVAEAWRRAWSATGVDPGEPSEMAAWREEHQRLASTVAQLRERERLLGSEQELVAGHVDALRSALSSLGFAPDAASLAHLVAQAQAVIADAQHRSASRQRAEAELARALADRPGRDQAAADQRSALADWDDAWAATLAPLRLSGDVRPSAALEAARAYRSLPGARAQVAGFEARIRGIERDLDAFAARVLEVATGLVEGLDRDPVEVVDELRDALGRARQNATAHATLSVQLADTEEILGRIELETGAAAAELAELCGELGLPRDAGLAPIIARSRTAAGLAEQIDQLERDLVAQGGGRGLAEVLGEAAATGMDGDELGAAIASLDDQVAALDAELASANQALGQATRDLEAVTAASTAADLEQDAQADLAAAAGHAAEHARTAVAAAILRAVIAEYGERHRGPILERASEVFARLTGDAFIQLVPEVVSGRQTLLAKRRNGELRTTAELSDGTRDQLYLALRLAGIEQQLEHLPERVPVLFDDVLVNFDDERSRAAIAVLAELGQKTQVLLFTHHETVVGQATATLPPEQLGVARLAERDHAAPLAAAATSGSTTATSTPRRAARGG